MILVPLLIEPSETKFGEIRIKNITILFDENALENVASDMTVISFRPDILIFTDSIFAVRYPFRFDFSVAIIFTYFSSDRNIYDIVKISQCNI